MNGAASAAEPLDLQLKATYDNPSYGEGDDLVKYMSMRDNGKISRQQYLESLTEDRQKRLIHERDRIEKLRAKFFKNRTKLKFIANHEKCRADWRDEAITNQKKNLEELQVRRERKRKDCESETGLKTFENEQRILETITKWDPKPQKMEYETESSVERKNGLDYGLKASIMHFKRGRGGHIGHTHKHHMVNGEFPDQKIPIEHLLSNRADNPIRERFKDDTYRYFHLPTNNMAWIEVRYSYL